MERAFLTTTEILGSPLNCFVTGGITYCSTFLEDEMFGADIDFFLFRWTCSCIASPEYELKDMLKAVLHETRQVLMLKALVLEPIDPGSILAGGFLEGHDFTTRHGRFGGRAP
jgi:hypothetical protein